jgi:hypothetical protein
MKVYSSKLQSAFRKVRQIREHMALYCINGKGVPVCPKELHWAVMDAYGLEIRVHKTTAGGTNVRALVLRRLKDGKPSDILISTNQPEDWFRFSQAKELSQILIDEEEDWSVDGAETLLSYFYEVYYVDKGDDGQSALPTAAVQSEEIAMYAAIEIMYPFEARKHDGAELLAGKTTAAKLALHYDLPQNIIGRALHPSYMELATRIWAEIDSVT